ncbi:MAG: signal peptidase I [Candidatus Shapirobacteria bacterium]|jgi:signal peptidase
MENIKLTLKYLGEVGVWIGVGLVAVMLALSFWTNSNGIIKTKPYIVQSGSMEPTINTGDIIIVAPQSKYYRNQVITFKDSEERVVTHRIVGDNQNSDGPFTTKGDANQTTDEEEITPAKIIGKVVFTLPKLGYVVAYSRTPTGLIILIIVPMTIIAYDEIRKIFKKQA